MNAQKLEPAEALFTRIFPTGVPYRGGRGVGGGVRLWGICIEVVKADKFPPLVKMIPQIAGSTVYTY
jgi:hypothetical protein